MQSPAKVTAPVGLKSIEDYIRDKPHLWPSVHSFVWWERQNRAALLKAGAYVHVGRRKLIDPALCDSVVVQLGRAAARRARVAL